MSETIDYRLLSEGEVIREGDEIFINTGEWEPAVFDVGDPVLADDNPIRRRTTLRDELAELADSWQEFAINSHYIKSLRALIAKHYPQEPQS